MKHRFHTNTPLTEGAVIPLAGDELHHARVVRVREGEGVEVFDGRGRSFAATMETLTSVRLGAEVPSRESPVAVELAMSVIQLEKLELVLQKATELGVAILTPLITDRMEVRAERFRGKRDRWQKIIFEAVKQSGRAAIPSLNEPMTFDQAIARDGMKVVYDAEVESETPQPRNPATLFIGPEGGFSPRELALAKTHGAHFASLGPRRLRAETAGIVAVALVIDLRAAAHPGR
jgi:16S rRNA (uracil1498-N3)-methyltransferase